MTILSLNFVSCKNEEETTKDSVDLLIEQGVLRGELDHEATLDASVTYSLAGTFIVKDGATLNIPAGTTIKANDTALAVINRIQPLLVSFALPEKHLPKLREALKESPGGMKVDVTLPENGDRHFEGNVRFIDNAVDATTGTILMKAELPNADESLTPGQFLNVILLLDTLHNAVTIPSEAVQQGADGNFVYVINKDGNAEVRKVETAASDGDLTAISRGLHTGETVVTDGQLRLTPGAKIKETNAAK